MLQKNKMSRQVAKSAMVYGEKKYKHAIKKSFMIFYLRELKLLRALRSLREIFL